MTIVELAHGIYRAKSSTDRDRRRAFSEELRRDMIIHPVTAEIAELAGRIEGEQAALGISIAFEDLLIGASRAAHRLRCAHAKRPPFSSDSWPPSSAGLKNNRTSLEDDHAGAEPRAVLGMRKIRRTQVMAAAMIASIPALNDPVRVLR